MFRKYLLFIFLNLFILVKGQMNPLNFNEYLSENYYRIHPAMAGVNLMESELILALDNSGLTP